MACKLVTSKGGGGGIREKEKSKENVLRGENSNKKSFPKTLEKSPSLEELWLLDVSLKGFG